MAGSEYSWYKNPAVAYPKLLSGTFVLRFGIQKPHRGLSLGRFLLNVHRLWEASWMVTVKIGWQSLKGF